MIVNKMVGYKRNFRRPMRKVPMRGAAKWQSYGSRAGGLAYRAWQGVKTLKSLINVERKFLDGNFALNTPTVAAPGLDWVTSVAQGSDYNQRDGISVKANSLYLRGHITLGGTVPVATNLRMCVVIDKEGLGTAPTITDLLESNNFESPLNHVNGRRFLMLMDKSFSLSPQGPQTVHFKKFFKLSHHLRWTNTTTGTREGHIYVIYWSDTYNVTTNFATVTYSSRLRFIDN